MLLLFCCDYSSSFLCQLFPIPHTFAFYEDSFKFIGVLFFIAVCGFVFSTINFIALGTPGLVIFIRALDLITIVVPPALPATMSIGTTFALSRLKQYAIYCRCAFVCVTLHYHYYSMSVTPITLYHIGISPATIQVAGQVNCVLYDKTGTLTNEGLECSGYWSQKPEQMQLCMAVCHSLQLFHADLVGDVLDMKMYS